MTTAAVEMTAKATMRLKIIRANGAVEEREVPVTTTITKAQVREMIARAQKE